MNLTRSGNNKIQNLCLIFFITLFFSFPTYSGCGNIPSPHALYSDSEIKLDASNIKMNRKSLSNGTYSPKVAIDTDGSITENVNLSFPDLDPSSFPSNSSNNVIEITSTTTLTKNSETFYKEISVKKKNGILSFAGSGPVHIGELKIEEQGVELRFDSGTYYINKFIISKKNFTVSLTDTPVIIHIGETFENKEQGSKINQAGSVDDFLVYLHSNTKFESTAKNLDFTGLIYGPNNVDIIKIAGQNNSINGAIIVSGGNIEVTEKNATFTLSASEQSALANISTCQNGGGGGDTAATNFNCVENGADAISGKLYTKTTAQSFSFDIVALRDANTVESDFASGADHTVTVELVKAETPAACESYPALGPAVAQSLTMIASDSGIKASAAMSSNTAYKAVKCRVTDATDSPSVIGCSTDSFAIRPIAFTISSNLTNAGSAGTPKAKAGENFTLTATATTGYNGTPAIKNTNLQAHAGAIQTGTISGSFTTADPATGIATGTAFSYSEVGLLRFITEGIYDDSFSAIDQSNDCTDDFSNTVNGDGKVGCKFGNTANSNYFGRFTPDHFVLSNKDFEDRINLSCPSDSIFSYIGEAFQTRFTITAENSSNNTTQNYTGSYAKLGGSDFNFGAIDLADAIAPTSATALSSQLSLVSTSGSWTNGVANMTANLGVTRSSPAGPFESFKLGIAPTDSDNITLSSYDLDTSVPSDSNDRELLASTKIRFGRLTIENAHGSELLSLPVPMQTEYYNGTDFIINSDDTCTPVNVSQLSFNGGTNPITVGSGTSTASIANSPLAFGLAGLSLSTPGANNTGFIDITSGSLITSYPWLSYDWDGDGNHDNAPSARATFGIYKGNTRQIYFREVY